MKQLLCILVLVAVAWNPVFSHHSFARFYLEDRSVSISGELVRFDYTNPHAWVYVSAPDASGTMRRYAAEWASPTRLGRQGIVKDTLRVGDRVVLTGSPGREVSEYRIHLKRIDRPFDGWSWKGGRERRR